MALSLVMVTTAVENGWIQRFSAMAATEAPEEETEIVEKVDETAGLLDDENGRISFWKWQKVTPKNFKEYFNDGNYHATMMVRYDNEEAKNPKGFISIYADKDHVYRGENASDLSDFDVVPSFVKRYMFDDSGTMDGRGYKYDLIPYFLMDEDGKSLNDHKEYFTQDSFYTTGGSMGVLWLRYLEDSENIEDDPAPAVFNVALSRAEMKNHPDNESYLDIGTGRGKDYYLKNKYYTEKSGNKGWIWDIWELATRLNQEKQNYYMKDGSRKELEDLYNGFKFMPWGEDWKNATGWTFEAGVGNFVIKNGWGVCYPGAKKYSNSAADEYAKSRKEGYYYVKDHEYEYYYEMYVGTPYVFASIKGEGGEDASGRGSTLTIKKNQLKIVKEGNYSKPDGTSGKSDGVVLPETSKIVIEEGGVLSVEGNFINNGTIINNGGTIIVKDGGCISPFGNTSEGKIKSTGGQIIVMPKGKLFCLEDEITPQSALCMVCSDTQASGLTNFGLTVLTHAELDDGSRIDNRNGGTLLAVHKRTDTSAMLKEAKVTGSGDDTKVEGIGKIDESYDGSIRGVTKDITPTVTNEKKATFVYKIYRLTMTSEDKIENVLYRDYSKAKDGSGGFTIFTPEY